MSSIYRGIGNAGTSPTTASASSTATNGNSTSTSNSKKKVTTRPGAYAVTQSTPGPAQVLRVKVPSGVRPGSEFVVHPQNPTRRTVRVRCPITSGPGKTLQITIPPEPITERKDLKPAKLTAAPGTKRGGGARTMTEDVVKSNEKRMDKYKELQQQLQQNSNVPMLDQQHQHQHQQNQDEKQEGDKQEGKQDQELPKIREAISQDSSSHHSIGSSTRDGGISSSAATSAKNTNNSNNNSSNNNRARIDSSSSSTTTTKPKAFLVIIPPNIHPGMPFTIDVQGKRYVINCPPDAGPGKKIKIIPPRPRTNTAESQSASSNAASASASAGGNRSRSNSHAESSNSQQEPRSRANTGNSSTEFEEQSESSLGCPGSGMGDSSGNHNSNNNRQEEQEQQQQQQPAKMQMFEVRVPAGVEPGQPFALAANGQRVLVTCPPNVQVGQKIRFNLPVTQQMVQAIQLQYEGGDGKTNASGWCRTIRVSDLKFQWVRVTKHGSNTGDGDDDDTNIDQSRRLLDVNAMNDFHFSKSAYGRHLTLLKGNDVRLRTGILSWVPAKDATVDSKLVLHQKVLLSYADIANIQQKPFPDKLLWFEESLSKLLLIPWEDGHVKMFLRRPYLLQDSVDAVMSLSRTQLRQRWRLEFANEPAIDAGGITREWFQLITQQLFDANFGLWMPSANNQACCTINPVSDVSCPNDHLIHFRFLGRIMGRALLDQQLIHGHLVRSLYKHILGWPITFDDLAAQDEEYNNSLQALLEMDEGTLEALCLDFTVTEELFGARQVVELIPNGADIDVTKDNLEDYLEANLRYHMLERTRLQLTELLLGFFDVVPEPVLTVFDSHELELILCGLPTIDMEDWEANTKYAGKFKEKDSGKQHKVVKWFWEIVRDEFDAELKARLLQFVTGTSGVPSRGFSVLQGNDGNIKKFCLQGVDSSEHDYPRAHTCFNRLDLPTRYSNKGELRSRLKTAITLSAVGFDME